MLCFTAASMGAIFTPGPWFAQLNKPSWNPPSWIFAPVWMTLYVMMAIAAWLVWRKGGFAFQRMALSLFLVQWFFNILWSPIFFGLHSPGLALVDMILLWFSVLATLIAFWKATPLAGALLVPYQLWLTFAFIINLTLVRINP
jgi:tryptophan-rich sensory protein